MRPFIRAHDPTFTFDGLFCNDPAVYEMICPADTVGVFQVESHAQMQVLPRLKPRAFSDLVIGISWIRPGPVRGNRVHPYLCCRDAKRHGLTVPGVSADEAQYMETCAVGFAHGQHPSARHQAALEAQRIVTR